MAEIPLTRGFVALIDADDYESVIQFKWYAHIGSRYGRPYAARRISGTRAFELMHRRLMPGVERVDHINGNGLDNRRANLRPSTHMQNLRNRRGPQAGNTSGYRGVYWSEPSKKWRAGITVEGRSVHLGCFTNPIDAAHAFDDAAIQHFGEFHGYLNFPEEN